MPHLRGRLGEVLERIRRGVGGRTDAEEPPAPDLVPDGTPEGKPPTPLPDSDPA